MTPDASRLQEGVRDHVDDDGLPLDPRHPFNARGEIRRRRGK
jgi:hypothetical protein